MEVNSTRLQPKVVYHPVAKLLNAAAVRIVHFISFFIQKGFGISPFLIMPRHAFIDSFIKNSIFPGKFLEHHFAKLNSPLNRIFQETLQGISLSNGNMFLELIQRLG